MHTIKLIFLISALIISPQLCAATPQLEQNPGWSGKNRDQFEVKK